MDTIFKNEYGNRAIIYGFLTEDDVKTLDLTLDKRLVIISHVGDGEYSHNTFGNVFTSYSKVLTIFRSNFERRHYKDKHDYLICIIQKTYVENGVTHYYVGYVRKDYKNLAKVFPSLVGKLTVERLNSHMFNEGN